MTMSVSCATRAMHREKPSVFLEFDRFLEFAIPNVYLVLDQIKIELGNGDLNEQST